MKSLSNRIRECRVKNGMTLLQVADKIGVKEATMQRYESGKIKNIKHETIEQLASIFDCTPAYLMGWEEDETPSPTPEQQAKERVHQLVDRLSPADLARVEAVIDAFLATQGGKEPENR